MSTIYTDELLNYLDRYDLDEEEFLLLEEWVSHGHSVKQNPDVFCELDGTEMDFMKWYWISQDDAHPEHTRLMNHRAGRPISLKDEGLSF